MRGKKVLHAHASSNPSCRLTGHMCVALQLSPQMQRDVPDRQISVNKAHRHEQGLPSQTMLHVDLGVEGHRELINDSDHDLQPPCLYKPVNQNRPHLGVDFTLLCQVMGPVAKPRCRSLVCLACQLILMLTQHNSTCTSSQQGTMHQQTQLKTCYITLYSI